jgi:hypothetical protein
MAANLHLHWRHEEEPWEVFFGKERMMKVHEGQGPVSQQITKHTNQKSSKTGDFQSIMEQIGVQSDKMERITAKEGVGPIVGGVQILHGVENKNESMNMARKRQIMGSLLETLDMVDFYASRLADASMPATDLNPLINHLEDRLDTLRHMESAQEVPEQLKSVISDMSITIGAEIARFKRGDYS